jgi:hypothetical protein
MLSPHDVAIEVIRLHESIEGPCFISFLTYNNHNHYQFPFVIVGSGSKYLSRP